MQGRMSCFSNPLTLQQNDLHDKMAALQIDSEAKARLVGEQGATLVRCRRSDARIIR